MMVNQAGGSAAKTAAKKEYKRRVTVELPAYLVMRADEFARSRESTATGFFREVILEAVASLPESQAERNMRALG